MVSFKEELDRPQIIKGDDFEKSFTQDLGTSQPISKRGSLCKLQTRIRKRYYRKNTRVHKKASEKD